MHLKSSYVSVFASTLAIGSLMYVVYEKVHTCEMWLNDVSVFAQVVGDSLKFCCTCSS